MDLSMNVRGIVTVRASQVPDRIDASFDRSVESMDSRQRSTS
jgi:hypothetical protein